MPDTTDRVRNNIIAKREVQRYAYRDRKTDRGGAFLGTSFNERLFKLMEGVHKRTGFVFIRRSEFEVSRPSVDEKAELSRLRKEPKRLRMERDILKRRRPSSRASRAQVRVHRVGEEGLSDNALVRGDAGFAQRLLRLARAYVPGGCNGAP